MHWKLFKTNYSSLVESPPTDKTLLTVVYVSLHMRKFIELVSNYVIVALQR